MFCDVVGRRSFSRAAKEHGITQSGVSQMVAQLEQDLGVKLLDRSKRPVVLTPEGEFYTRAVGTSCSSCPALEEEVAARCAARSRDEWPWPRSIRWVRVT